MTAELQLKAYIAAETTALHHIVRLYVLRAGLATDHEAESVADDVWHETVVEALRHATRFDTGRQPKAWLLGIAANLIKRRQVERAKQMRREPLVRDLHTHGGDEISDDDLFDRLAGLPPNDPAYEIERKEQIEMLLMGVSEADQLVLRLGILHGLNGDLLAEALGTTPGAARVRLHRALNRLRTALNVQQEVRRHD